jgi:ABC-type phosphate transport system substrate-binding protein
MPPAVSSLPAAAPPVRPTFTNASRAINNSERNKCRAIGREPIEIRVGIDALVVVVSEENEFA